MTKFCRIFFILSFLIFVSFNNYAQVNAVTFGKNRIQYKKLKWQYYQSKNFNVYFYENGEELAKYILQLAEKELPQIESAAEYSLQRRANIIVYNDYADMQQTNIGLETDILNTGASTSLVNNKMLVYFDANHANMRKQVRLGISSILTQNILFGDDIGEVAGNQTLLDLPKWFTDGYQAYIGENWSTTLDDELKTEILSGSYSKFSKFSFSRPLLAGHAFWYFIEEKYKKETVTYLFFLSRTYKNINKACLQITNKNFKQLSAEFMEYQDEKYSDDNRKRKPYPKGKVVESFDINPRLNYYRFNVNPNKKNNSYVVSRFKKGIVSVILTDDNETTTLIKYGIRKKETEINPNYPMMAWDPKGTKIAVVHPEKGKLKLFVYDVVGKYKQYQIDLTNQFDQVQDIKYLLDNRTLLLSAVKNGHTDLYSFDLEKEKAKQITNDVFDDLDPNFVTFPNKMGIIFSSNRPSATAGSGDTTLPSNNRFNVFLITDFGDKPELNQITQLTNMKYGNARYPAQYNINHFTFVSDENGIANRYAGFFTTKKIGVDTLVQIGVDLLRNPSQKEIDSTLNAYNKTNIDSLFVVSISADSAYSFPLTNYETGLDETKSSGEDRILSEVSRQIDEKILYKLKVDENTLNKRNVTAQPTAYARKLMRESKLTVTIPATKKIPEDELKNKNELFQTEFFDDSTEQKNDKNNISSSALIDNLPNILNTAKKFRYKPIKFSAESGSAGFNTAVLYNRYQPYDNGRGPVMLSSNTPLNGLIRMSAFDLMEDIRVTGAFKIGTNLQDNEWLVNYQNLKRRIDWGFTYYRNVIGTQYLEKNSQSTYNAKLFTNLYQGNISYPFDEARSIRFSTGIRADNLAVKNGFNPVSAEIEDSLTLYSVSRLEFVYDNSLRTAVNILDGLRYKVFVDWNRQINKKGVGRAPSTFNFGFDLRYYYPIYKNFIWAGRAAGDFSWGSQKFIYYLGGTDGWLMFGDNIKPGTNKERYFNSSNTPANDQTYAFQSLAVNMRGHIQNAANGNNTIVLNSELRLPVLSTFFDKMVNNAFLNDFQITQFIDLGTAWNGAYNTIKRPDVVYSIPSSPVSVRTKAGGVGPFLGGYGFGARSTVFGYYLKYDIGWPMTGFFNTKPVMYFSLGLDF